MPVKLKRPVDVTITSPKKVVKGVSNAAKVVVEASGLEISSCHPSELQPHPRNVRVHPEDNILSIVKSLQSFGQRTPIVVWQAKCICTTVNSNPDCMVGLEKGNHDLGETGSRYILKGNGTHEAIKRLGWDVIFYVDASHLPAGEAEAYAIADNKTGDLSHFDFSKLAEVLRDLEGQNIDLESTGFRAFEREPLLQATFNTGPAGTLPGSNGELPPADMKHLKFTSEQWDIIKAALDPIREVETEFDVSDEAGAIVAACYRITEQRIKWKTNVPF